MNPRFFFDTADELYIRTIWKTLRHNFTPNSVLGVTTNPSALSKVGCDTLFKLELVIPSLCRMVTELRDGQSGGVVHVQLPRATMTVNEVFEWARYVQDFTDGSTTIALKVPHYTHMLELTSELSDMGLEINVTGIADWATLLKAFQYDIVWASLITGRMEEVKIDANEHMEHIARIKRSPDQHVIAGSMRTIRGLRDAIFHYTIPTIGKRVWDLLMDVHEITIESLWDDDLSNDERLMKVTSDLRTGIGHVPYVGPASRLLSSEFFVQMDTLGKPLYMEFVS